jgi:hypothetical protein
VTATETATDIDLDALIEAIDARRRARPRRALRNRVGRLVTPAVNAGRIIVNPGDVIESAWGNATYDQTVQVYNSDADRTSQWPTPLPGAVSYLLDSASLWVRTAAGVWKGIPAGVLSTATQTANSAVTSSATGVTWYTAPPFTIAGNRRVRVTFAGILTSATAGDLVNLRLMEGATVLMTSNVRVTATGGGGAGLLNGFWTGVPPAGTHTYLINVALQAGTGAVTALASASAPSQVLIEDIGT